MAEDAATKRAAGLLKLFNAVIHGHREVKSAADGNRFLEALYTQEDMSKCVESLIASSAGLPVVAKSFRFSRDSTFLNGPATSVIHSLAQPSVKQLYNGEFLHRALEQIVQPPTFWNTLVEAHNARILTPKAIHAFAWLLLELLQLRLEEVDVRQVAERITETESFLKSDSHDIRTIGQNIKYRLDISAAATDDGHHPGGRHDNDFADYRSIKLLPTPDEFASTERPFYRQADAVNSVEPEQRGLMHLDNQFRLLREDLLGELRSDFQIATGQKKGRRKVVIEQLMLEGFDCGSSAKRKACLLRLRCTKDIPQLRHIKGVALRKRHISDTKHLMKHNSFGCLISGGNIIGFATVDRNEDLLAEQPAAIVLRIADTESFGKVLMACKTASKLDFIQIDTAVFAYEPILKCLQSMTELPMDQQLLHLTEENAGAVSGIQPDKIVETIRKKWEDDLQDIVGTSHPVQLDLTQTESLIAGLTKKVSLIQGPPGEFKFFYIKA